MSIREDSFFFKKKLSITRVIYTVHHYSCGASTSTLRRLANPFPIDRHTLTSILTELQKRMVVVLAKKKPIFTTDDEVEMDEM